MLKMPLRHKRPLTRTAQRGDRDGLIASTSDVSSRRWSSTRQFVLGRKDGAGTRRNSARYPGAQAEHSAFAPYTQRPDGDAGRRALLLLQCRPHRSTRTPARPQRPPPRPRWAIGHLCVDGCLCAGHFDHSSVSARCSVRCGHCAVRVSSGGCVDVFDGLTSLIRVGRCSPSGR